MQGTLNSLYNVECNSVTHYTKSTLINNVDHVEYIN